MMTRKDYRALAGAIAATREHMNGRDGSTEFEQGAATALDVAVLMLADVLAADNPRFSVERFARAANPAGR